MEEEVRLAAPLPLYPAAPPNLNAAAFGALFLPFAVDFACQTAYYTADT